MVSGPSLVSSAIGPGLLLKRRTAMRNVQTRWRWSSGSSHYETTEFLGKDGVRYWETSKNEGEQLYIQATKQVGGVKLLVCSCPAWLFSESRHKRPSSCKHTESIRARLDWLRKMRRIERRREERYV